jgi:hypothetical protein
MNIRFLRRKRRRREGKEEIWQGNCDCDDEKIKEFILHWPEQKNTPTAARLGSINENWVKSTLEWNSLLHGDCIVNSSTDAN